MPTPSTTSSSSSPAPNRFQKASADRCTSDGQRRTAEIGTTWDSFAIRSPVRSSKLLSSTNPTPPTPTSSVDSRCSYIPVDPHRLASTQSPYRLLRVGRRWKALRLASSRHWLNSRRR
ncbi:hypothetical protein L3Y34_005459 [Caenorhabditis briggsae]|uniref:Uncharacterized protein n=1 Tax=Caenorhabditis briggsae TaxID=6238 RepID=A0AAE9D793_CAEBR|nr:hypothetical protein L3Y34_005459 [Caenorhabditis briggsae]